VFVGVDARNLILADLYNSRFFKEYSDRESLDVIQDRDVTVVYELPPNPAAVQGFPAATRPALSRHFGLTVFPSSCAGGEGQSRARA
jgi:hypothetical protein